MQGVPHDGISVTTKQRSAGQELKTKQNKQLFQLENVCLLTFGTHTTASMSLIPGGSVCGENRNVFLEFRNTYPTNELKGTTELNLFRLAISGNRKVAALRRRFQERSSRKLRGQVDDVTMKKYNPFLSKKKRKKRNDRSNTERRYMSEEHCSF